MTLAVAAIFHGAPVPPAETPWLVSLTTRGPICGGALIAPDRVLTAAHCVSGADPGRVSVRIAGRRHAWRGAYFPTRLPRHLVAGRAARPQRLGHDQGRRDHRAPASGDRRRARAARRHRARRRRGHTDRRPRPHGPGPVGPSARALGAVQEVMPSARAWRPTAPGCCTRPAPVHASTRRRTTRRRARATAAARCSSAATARSSSPASSPGAARRWGATAARAPPTSPSARSAHLALLTGALPSAPAPYAERRVRVRRSGATRRCVIGAWSPSSARFTVRWFRRDGLRRQFLPGAGARASCAPAGSRARSLRARPAAGRSKSPITRCERGREAPCSA